MPRVLKTSLFVIIMLLLLSLVFLVSVTPAYAISVEDLIVNSLDNPYILSTSQDILDLSNLVNTGSSMSGKFFALGSDIDLSSEAFVPIGKNSTMFQGSFDGRNYKITININNSSNYNGLFGYIGNSGVVKNVVVSGSITANNYLGGIAGYNAGTISNCINTANIATVSNDSTYIGGISGESMGRIDNCVNAGTIIVNKSGGGIVGRNLSSTQGIFSSVNLGNISGREGSTSAERIGGIAGESRGIIANCFNYAFVNATGQRIGALVGSLVSAPNGTINCYNITEKAARALVGQSDVQVPATFLAKSYYDFLEKTIVFAESSMRYLTYEQGFGFLPYPNTLTENAEIKSIIRICLFSSGTGEIDQPFVINNFRQWGLFQTNSYLYEYTSKHIRLNTNLIVGNISPLFSTAKPFKGVFEGDNKILTANVSGSSRVGLFAVISGGTVRNITINGIVTATGDMAGAVAGVMFSGTLQNITSNASVTGKNFVGGIIGHASQDLVKLSNIKNNGQVSGENQVGGLIGQANIAELTDIENHGKVSAVTGSVNANFGGIVGKTNMSAQILRVLNSGEVNAHRATNVGGIVGYDANGSFELVANLGAVIGRNNVGGICGNSFDSSNKVIKSAMNVAAVTGAVNVAGMLGLSSGVEKQINNSYFVGTLNEVTEAQINKATFYTISSGTNIVNCFFNNDLITGTGGTGKNHIELTDNVFGVTEIDTVWQARSMEANVGYYPILKINSLTSNTALINSKLRINYFSGGTGAPSDPYLIANEQTLRNFAYLNNNYTSFDYHNKSYKLTSDISLKRDLYTICSSVLPFDGNFNGNYKIINNLNITGGDYTGFFASLSANAVVSKFFVESGEIVGNNYTGTIAGFVSYGASIIDSYSNAEVDGQANIGGLVGVNYGQIADSFFTGQVSGTTNIGGLVGRNGISGEEIGTITRSFSSGYVFGSGNVGGIVGQNQGNISICQVSGTVHLVSADGYSGGIAGEHLIGDITNSYVIAVLTSEGVGAKTGGLVGQFTNTGAATLTYSYYHPVISGATTPYYIGITPLGDTTGRIKNTEQMLNNAFLGDLNYNFSFGLSPSKDSDFAPRINSFVNTGIERKEHYSSYSAKLRVFGWDNTSQAEWGTEANPYIISTPSQLDTLSKLTATYKYTYSGNYFVLNNDINMQGIAFAPIGRFISASGNDNFMFNGVFDGNGKTISNLTINRTYRYIGLFGYTGSEFVLKNLILDSSCSFITSDNYAGSLVGYNGGTIDRCVSYATVSAANYIGGLCAYSAVNTTITNSVFYGNIPTVATNSYGILGIIPSAGIAVNTSNTWYVYKNNLATNIKASALPYQHNDYGCVLFVDSLGTVSIVLDTVTTNINNILAFGITANTYYVGAVMSNIDGLVYSGNNFYPYPVFKGARTTNFVRFCQTARLNFLESSDSDYMTNYTTNYGNGIYYEGQSVNFTIKLQKNCYLENLPHYANNNYQLRNVASDIVMRFTMASNSSGSYFDVPISIEDATTLVDVACSDLEVSNIFDGATKTIAVTFSGGVFDYYTLSFYYGAEMNNVSEIRNAGSYTVYTYLYMVGNRGVFYGIMQHSFTVLPYELFLDDTNQAIDNYWATNVGVKTYDGSAQILGKTILSQYLLTIVEEDTQQVNITADVTWASANASNNIDVTINNFLLSGALANNYTIASGTSLVLAGRGRINKKALIVTISSVDLSMPFSGNAPIIKNPQVNGSLGSTSLVWTFVKLNELGGIDTDWANLATKTYFVGRYNVLVSSQDTNNYDITFGGSNYVLEILPRSVNSISYSDYENKVYTGSVLSNNIKAIYTTVNGMDFATLNYYKGSVSEENLITDGVINAGIYIAVPTITNPNYQFSQSVSNLSFAVAKATASDITFDMDSNNIKVNDMRLLTFTTNVYDAVLAIEISGVSRAKVSLAKVEDTYYFNPTAYPSSGSITYRIAAKGATNYNDRYSQYHTVSIGALSMYVGVKSRVHIYGDIIDLELQYSSDIEQNNIVSMEEVQSLSGYKPSTYQVVYSTLEAGKRYTVNIGGGDFAAYKIYNANTCYIDIEKRKIKITVSPEMQALNTKIYGSNDTSISYIVIDGHEEGAKQITTLPNGEELLLNGVLSRASGENAGNYAINIGTISVEANPSYDILADFRGVYKIDRKPLRLYIPSQTKPYKAADPVLSARLENDCTLAYNDTMSVVAISIIRAQGESVGSYNYTVTSSSVGNNYRIESIRNDQKFLILKGTPTPKPAIHNTLYYGETVSSLTISGQAQYRDVAVAGKFSWEKPSVRATSMDAIVAKIVFTPDDTVNYNVATFDEENPNVRSDLRVILQVHKRVLGVSLEGSLSYEYNGSRQCDIVAKFANLYNGETVTSIEEIRSNGDITQPINAGEYTYLATINSDKYIIVDDNSISFVIYPKDVTVSVANVTIVQGETPKFAISYVGFLEGDDENDIDTKATIVQVPKTAGRHTITPSNASDQNYYFIYQSGTLTINQKQIAKDNITITGSIKPGVTVDVVSYDNNRLEFKAAAKLIDSSTGANIIKPSKMSLNQLVGIDFSEKVSGEYSYSVSLSEAVTASNVFYALGADGDVVLIEEYTLSEDGKTINFVSSAISGVAVYSPKDTIQLLQGYIPHAIAGVGALLVIVLIIVGIRIKIKRNKFRRAYLRSLDS